MNTESAGARVATAYAGIIALSIFFVDPIYQSLLIAHAVMLAFVGAWLMVKSPRAAVVTLAAATLFTAYLLLVDTFIGLGDRIVNESVKYGIIVLFIAAIIDFPYVARKALYYFAFLIPALLVLYILFGSDPFIYGGRLGVAISSVDDSAMVSANTIGFAINISIVTVMARKPKAMYYLAPIFAMLLYFTLSRGAILSILLVTIAYFIRTNKLLYVTILSLPIIFLVVDMNAALFETFRLDDATGSGRTIIYEIMFENMVANPITFLLGNAPGNLDFEIYAGKRIVSAHSGYFEMLYTFGLFGLSAVLYFLFNILRNFRILPLDTLLYAVLIASYAISEDLMGAHNLIALGLMLGLILKDFGRARRWRLAHARGLMQPRRRVVAPVQGLASVPQRGAILAAAPLMPRPDDREGGTGYSNGMAGKHS